ncbi:hypothetical protein M406DRAFT_323439 [Cryphonectria parasitica EP155]|uniref:Uncharacterized protein n=1 Tax=Cryphonectria parasitica (strain ATCC 38755 / EP155) TaxID=660469 RepID=A0A9P4XWC9_CRYP1|nr:uncharacterized protein M406DRAFT_323439 [Cryphonectria parasitica EP155]KAF3762121.1 hypothetical protein M406DRAFT_323439 [Cryphonectria parasitica EP155]
MEARERKAQVDIMPATQAQSSKKRVHWDSGNVDEDEDEGAVLGSNESSSHGNSDGSYDEKPLSKRRKTHQGTTDEAHVLPQRRRTRSMSRAEDATPRRTRSRSRATE